ncbi:MAG: DUF2863 family protein [Hydrogenophilus sp.]|nr:DUF2863 family protein [Hydrogenophilus sp.]
MSSPQNPKPKSRRKGPSAMLRSAEHLCRLAEGLSQSGSRIEDRWWEQQLETALRVLLEEGDEATIEQALEHLYRSDEAAYGELLDAVESEAAVVRDKTYDLLLIAAPILAWSRYSVPAKGVPPAVLSNLRTAFAAYIFAPDVRFAIADHLFSPDQLPEGYLATRRFLLSMEKAALANEDFVVDSRSLNETLTFLSDIRYLLIAAAVPKGEAIYRWHLAETTREKAFSEWRKRVDPILERLFVGCGIEVEPPDAYFTASRKANRDARVFAIHAAIAYLATEFDIPTNRLKAVVAPCESNAEFEFRIGLSLKPSGQVVHGIPWPLIGNDESEEEMIEKILATLRDCGVSDIVELRRTLPLEYCEDCGAPLFPNVAGELVHAELPGDPHGENDNPRNHGNPPPRYLH